MHTVEAFLAVADAIKEEKYRIRAGRIIDHVIGWASANDWRIPEHFTKEWKADLDCNKRRKVQNTCRKNYRSCYWMGKRK